MLNPITNRLSRYFFPPVLLLLVISSFSRDTTIPDYVEDGEFTITVLDELQGGITGSSDYRTREALTIGNAAYHQWQFSFTSQDGPIELELLISPPGGIMDIYAKTFKVDTEINSFLEPEHGLFGTALLESISDLPFFTRDGSISIKDKNSQTIRGTIDLFMENAAGKQIEVKGLFAAKSAEVRRDFTILKDYDHINTETPSRVAL